MKNKEEILKVLDFYSVLGRPLTLLEIKRLVPFEIGLNDLLFVLQELEKEKRVHIYQGFYSISKKDISAEKRKEQDLLLDKKWRKLNKLRFLFSFIPFIDFVFISGSLALGNIRETSDFDVLIGCKSGRIFTVRFLAIFIFGLPGVRRKRIEHKISASNKICLNHFVTPKSYKLTPPYSFYWEELYMSLVPFIGKKKEIVNFWNSNRELIKKDIPILNAYFSKKKKNIICLFFEKMFNARLGDKFEELSRNIQIRRIKGHLKKDGAGFRPRLIYNDNELEFHPDTRRIYEMLKKMNI